MNESILNIEIQEFINSKLHVDVSDLLLKGVPFEDIPSKDIISQIEAKKRCKTKLPTWFNTNNIYYPNKLNIEQTSSEITANYKAQLVSGQSLIDITGGFGVDAYYFSKHIDTVVHCEINDKLSEIVAHNYKALGANNINCLNENGIDTLKRLDKSLDWIYIDPSRRDASKNKVFLLSDCTPNVKTLQGLFLKYATNVMIKTSPLLDIKATKADLKFVKELHIVTVDNDVKELLWILKRDYIAEFGIKAVNITKTEIQQFDFNFENEANATATFSEPLAYLYEPNSAILKSGAFNIVSQKLGVSKLHKHSHLYTSNKLIDFPGRRFQIENVAPFNKKAFAKHRISKANVTTRNFPISVGDIRKKLKIKDGGDIYLFFTTNVKNEKAILICSKI